jgi:hypothetical protein
MVLAVAVVFLGIQMAPTVGPVLVSSSVASSTVVERRTPTSSAGFEVNFSSGESVSTPASEESSSTTYAATRLKIDSIYAVDKGKQPGMPVLVAQNSQSFSTIRIPDPNEKRYPVREAESAPARREWLALAVLEHSAAAFDAYSTRDAISRGAKEEDPMMRPFAHSPAIYAAIQVGPVVFDLMARHMQRSQNSFLRRTWWVPQSVSTGASIFSGVHNLSVMGNR